MLSAIKKWFGDDNAKTLKSLQPYVDQIGALEEDMKKMSDSELQAQTIRFKERLAHGESLSDILPEAFATVREASIRVLKMRHFDVQLIGGIVLFQGRIAEMKTGEGKTLCATLPLYLHGLSGKGAHLITVNDYLASRDAREMGELLNWLGISVGCIVANMNDEDRKEAYKCDVTYGTNNEFAFDYLRDNMKFDLEDYVQRGHNFCIVDEVDSILIDEARTPLLISGPAENKSELYQVANRIIPTLEKVKDFTVDEKNKSAVLTDDGIIKIQKMLNIDNLYNLQHTELLHHLNQALKAHHLFTIDIDYVVKGGNIIIVDEFTGRLKEGSRWSDGLHQAVEAKEGVKIKSENQTLASITFQNYFRLYNKLSGMTGTAETEADEFKKIYNLSVVVVPTNLPMIRNDMADVIYKTREGKFRAVCKLIKDLHEKGQPVLVGTISIDTSEQLSLLLKKEKIPHEVLNAKQHEREASIVANAGAYKAVTIATNMAGRGTDIKLTPQTKELGGLFILGTERHESRRIDNQLRGRSGRQGDPGASKFFLSLEDDLMRIFGSGRIAKIMGTLGMSDDEPIEHRMISNAVAKAQIKVESHNFDIRKHLLEYDNVMNEQRSIIYRIRKEILSDQDNWGLIKGMIEDVMVGISEQARPDKKKELDLLNWNEINSTFSQHLKLVDMPPQLSTNECREKFDNDFDAYLVSKAYDLIDKKFNQYDPKLVIQASREILLSIFDKHWKDHLLQMDHMKEGISLRAYAQKDPLTEYKRESFRLFEQMRWTIKQSIVDTIYQVHIYTEEEIEEHKRQQQEALEKQLAAHKAAQQQQEEGPISRSNQKIGRNDPCPCGSGKKFKHCHGA